jgi:mannan endo-1,4-beta-mannosidase
MGFPVGLVPLLLVCLACQGPSPAHGDIRLEAEDAQQFGTRVVSSRPGFSGSGYVTGFTTEGAHIAWHFKARSGIYAVHVRYSSPTGPKGYEIAVNGSKVSAMFSQTAEVFSTADAGRVELKDGENEIDLNKGWGWFDIDYLELAKTPVPSPPAKPPRVLTDPQAEPCARRLFDSLVDRYGALTLSGQYNFEDTDYVVSKTAVVPAILGGDFMDYSPSRVAHGSKTDGDVEKMVAAAKGRITTMSWHWNAPTDLIDKVYKDAQGHDVDGSWYKGFYTNATTFDFAKAIDDPSSPNYRLLIRDIDAIAVQLRKFDRAGVPILWRPLHEAEGGWFWWGAKGPEHFKKLWRLMFRRLTVEDGLHNLIWVYSSGTDPNWYPGDDVVDIVGIDAYPADQADPLTATWDLLQQRFSGKKLLAVSEFGGVPDVERMRRFGVFWSYFVSWGGTIEGIKPEHLRELYREQHVGRASIH